MPYDPSSCDCSYGLIRVKPAQCRLGCGGEGASYGWNGALRAITQKRIWHTVRVPESLYLSDLAALTVVGGSDNYPVPGPGVSNLNWNQSSDRARPHTQIVNVPSHGNSTKTTLTRNRPGASTPGGKGVDVKHGSYARYLARKKAGNLVTRPALPTPGFDADLNVQVATNPRITKGYKIGTFGIVAGGYQCPCNPLVCRPESGIHMQSTWTQVKESVRTLPSTTSLFP